MNLFDDKKRVIKAKKRENNQSMYDYLDISGLIEHKEIREFLNLSIHLYDQDSQRRIINDILKNKNSDEKFYSTCFELIVSYIFRKIGGYTLEPHPNLPNTNKKPDFLVKISDTDEFYLELVTIGEYNENQINEIRKFIEKFHNISKSKNIETVIMIKNIKGRDFSHDNIKELYKEIREWWSINKNIPGEKLCKEFNENSICFQIVEKDNFQTESLIDNVKFHTHFLDSIEKKSDKYGRLELPFLIAVTFRPSIFSDGLELLDTLIASCLYGGKIFDIQKKKEQQIKSFWEVFKQQKRNNHIGGILYFDSLIPERLKNFGYMLFLNDFSHKKLPSDLKDFLPYYYVIDENRAEKDSEPRRVGGLIVNARLL